MPLEYGAARVLEIAVPWVILGKDEQDAFSFYAVIRDNDAELERHPRGRVIEVQRHGEELNGIMWTA